MSIYGGLISAVVCNSCKPVSGIHFDFFPEVNWGACGMNEANIYLGSNSVEFLPVSGAAKAGIALAVNSLVKVSFLVQNTPAKKDMFCPKKAKNKHKIRSSSHCLKRMRVQQQQKKKYGSC